MAKADATDSFDLTTDDAGVTTLSILDDDGDVAASVDLTADQLAEHATKCLRRAMGAKLMGLQ